MGGMVGQWLGANAPERIERLVLTNTSSYFPDKTAWNDRLKLVREKGVAGVRRAQHGALVHQGLPRALAGRRSRGMQEMFAATPLEGYIACGEAVRDMDQRDLLPKIKAPTLVIAGKHDPATPPEANEYIKNHIPGAQFAMLDAAHISNVEQPRRLRENGAGISAGRETVAEVGAQTTDVDARRGPRHPSSAPCHGERNDGRQGALPEAARMRAARSWAMPGSTAPTPARPPSTPSGRISSPAAPGARSGRARISTSARAASW